jgi:predicted ester cyclase
MTIRLAALAGALAAMIAPATAAEPPTGAAANEALVRAYFEALFVRDDAAAAAAMTGGAFAMQWREGVPAGLKAMRASFPDLRPRIDAVVAGPSSVAVFSTWEATHSGAPFLGLAAAGARVRFQSVDAFEVAEGKLVRFWDVANLVPVLNALGAVQLPPGVTLPERPSAGPR